MDNVKLAKKCFLASPFNFLKPLQLKSWRGFRKCWIIVANDILIDLLACINNLN